MAICPKCSTPGAYVGFNSVECRNPDCEDYKIEEASACACCGKPESDCKSSATRALQRLGRRLREEAPPSSEMTNPCAEVHVSSESFFQALVSEIGLGSVAKLGITPTEPFEEARAKVLWGTYGKSGREPLKYVKLIDCSDEHLRNIQRTQNLGTAYAVVVASILLDRDSGKLPRVSDTPRGLAPGELTVVLGSRSPRITSQQGCELLADLLGEAVGFLEADEEADEVNSDLWILLNQARFAIETLREAGVLPARKWSQS
jgi:hypothetical protein